MHCHCCCYWYVWWLGRGPSPISLENSRDQQQSQHQTHTKLRRRWRWMLSFCVVWMQRTQTDLKSGRTGWTPAVSSRLSGRNPELNDRHQTRPEGQGQTFRLPANFDRIRWVESFATGLATVCGISATVWRVDFWTTQTRICKKKRWKQWRRGRLCVSDVVGKRDSCGKQRDGKNFECYWTLCWMLMD